MSTDTKQPERTFGPYLRGIKIAIWCNTVDTPSGPKTTRSIKINPPRYQDPKDGLWKDSKSFFESDLRVLAAAIADALAYIESHPLSPAGGKPIQGESESHSHTSGGWSTSISDQQTQTHSSGETTGDGISTKR